MVKQNKSESNMVKKETMLIVALVALVVGFLGGIFYSAMQNPSGSVQTASAPGAPSQQQSQSNISSEQARAILSLEQEVAANPTNANAWLQLGNVYYDTGNPPKSIKAYEKFLELRPGDPNVLTDLGVMYRRNGQSEKALEAFNKAIALDPTHQQSRFNKGVVLLNDLNDREGAIKAWQELLKINPDAVTPNGKPLTEVIKNL